MHFVEMMNYAPPQHQGYLTGLSLSLNPLIRCIIPPTQVASKWLPFKWKNKNTL